MSKNVFLHIFLKFFLPLATLVLLGVGFYGSSEIERELLYVRSQETIRVNLGAGVLSNSLESIVLDIQVLSNHSSLRSALDNPTPQALAHLEEDLLNFSAAKSIYYQLRWIDETGMERVRIDYKNGQPKVIPADKLQNKGGRYFFTDAIKLKAQEIFISPLDLNIENGQIEQPYNPMIRVATPLFNDNGKSRGIFIVNYYSRIMLDAFANITRNNTGHTNHAILVNSDGYWLNSNSPDDEWGFMLQRPDLSLAAKFPDAWRHIRAADTGQEILEDGLWTWQTVYPLLGTWSSSTGATEAHAPSQRKITLQQYWWKSISYLPAITVHTVTWAIWFKLISITILLLGILGFSSWKLAKAWVAQATAEAEITRINAGLKEIVAARTQELNQKIREIDEANEELRRRNEDMESMIYIASHDLRSPLVNIQGFSQRLDKAIENIKTRLTADDVPNLVQTDLHRALHERMPTALNFIQSSSRKLDTLINGLLRLSRAGRSQLNVQTLNMDAMLQEIITNLTIQIQSASATVFIASPLPACQGDIAEINQVFTNLIDNAIKYRDSKRTLQISIAGTVVGHHACYTVTDNGLGIAEEYQANIWQLFHRLNPNGPVGGEGIGLTLVRRILDRHRGKIWIQSAANEGSVFHVELPTLG